MPSQFEIELIQHLDSLVGTTYLKHEITGINDNQNSADAFLTTLENGLAVRKKYLINKMGTEYIVTETTLPEDEKIKQLEEKLASLDTSVNDLYISTITS